MNEQDKTGQDEVDAPKAASEAKAQEVQRLAQKLKAEVAKAKKNTERLEKTIERAEEGIHTLEDQAHGFEQTLQDAHGEHHKTEDKVKELDEASGKESTDVPNET